MDNLVIYGGEKLYGNIDVHSSKNAVLPIMAASILTDEEVVIRKCPKIDDVKSMCAILENLGCTVKFEGESLKIKSISAYKFDIPNNLAKELRSSIFLMGSILARYKKAILSYPGGCDIGLRPINLHIQGLKALGVKIIEEENCIICDGSDIRGGEVVLDFPSVGATENIMMAAVLASGKTTIHNPAKEPEIVDLQNFLNRMGAKVVGAGSNRIEIEGVPKLKGVDYTPIPDRIVAGTYLIAAAITGGEIQLKNANSLHLSALIDKLKESTCKIDSFNDIITIKAPLKLNAMRLISTTPYPGFPTDLQAPVLTLQTVSNGVCILQENMFETRYKHVSELKKMGANITVRERLAIIRGVKCLDGAEVVATDLRGGAALVLAGLAARGKTIVTNLKHIDRGYESIEENFRKLGAKITRE